MNGTGSRWRLAGVLVVWGVSRAVLLLLVFKVVGFPGPDDVTVDVSVTYQGWYEVLRQGGFPVGDVTWQYPPAAALAVLSPAALPFLGYTSAFHVLALLADLAVLCLLLCAGRRPGRPLRGAWVWTAGAPLLGPVLYARYDVMVTAVAVAALLAGARHPRAMGALAGFGALLKVWPVLLLPGLRGTAGRRAWTAAAATAVALGSLFALTMPGALSFVTAQRDRGTEVEAPIALVLHMARHFGWHGQVLLTYGSLEFAGPYTDVVSTASLALTVAALGWLLLWRHRARRFRPHTATDAAFAAVLLFTVTSRVLSPQYLVWLIGLAAVRLCFRDDGMRLPAGLVLAAAPVTALEFPVYFAHVVASDRLGVTLLLLRNGLLVAAVVTACRALWRSTVTAAPRTRPPKRTARPTARLDQPS
ncbi:glycosyltransferase 87 family protein [Streptomyces sp. NPDC017179]|uniref:glycosyltransferase 87 family protein n=1 Tax=Streptomyces sp. NPDC017179 TaxID=3364979 RepID=UPI003791ACA2